MSKTSFFEQKTDFFDRWAPGYDCLLTTVFYQAIHQRLLDYVSLPAQAQVLDLGCGTGKFLNRLAARFPDLRGLGLDLSPVMLRQARRKNQHHPRLIFCPGNAESIPSGDAKGTASAARQFDAVFNTISFLHYPDPQRVFQEIARVLRPQGKFYLADYSPRCLGSSLSLTPGGLKFYSAQKRQELAQTSGLQCQGHYYLLGPVLLSIFTQPG